MMSILSLLDSVNPDTLMSI